MGRKGEDREPGQPHLGLVCEEPEETLCRQAGLKQTRREC